MQATGEAPAARPTGSSGAFERGRLWSIVPENASAAELPSEFDWREAGRSRLPELGAAMESGTEAEERFGRGVRCFTASVDGRTAAYGWLTPGSECIGELERHIRLDPREAYIWDCFTLPEYRRRGLYTGILRLMVSTLAQEGFTRVWIGASVSNRASMRAFPAAGFQPALTVVYVRIGRMSCLVTRPVPRATATLVDMTRRIIAEPDERRWGPLYLRRLNSSRMMPCSSELEA